MHFPLPPSLHPVGSALVLHKRTAPAAARHRRSASPGTAAAAHAAVAGTVPHRRRMQGLQAVHTTSEESVTRRLCSVLGCLQGKAKQDLIQHVGGCHGLRFVDAEKRHSVLFDRCGMKRYSLHGVVSVDVPPSTLYTTPCGLFCVATEQCCHTNALGGTFQNLS